MHPSNNIPDNSRPANACHSATGKKATILVVDDEALVRDLATAILEENGYTVINACSGEEALSIYTGRGKEIDLVIMDMLMPGMDGRKTYRAIKEINPDVKVVFVSGITMDGMEERLTGQGAVRYIRKPFDYDDFCEKIQASLNS
jgi:two-component system, cell cycle sensor histidine kinase and response regulator CckA